MPTLAETVLVALLAGSATGIGALPTLFATRVSHRIYDAALGLAAGVMIGAAMFTLVLPGLELGTVTEVVAGIAVGGGGLLLANRYLPHAHPVHPDEPGTTIQPDEPGAASLQAGSPEVDPTPDTDDPNDPTDPDALRRALLVGGSITLHNVPEGLAIGIAFASGETGVGVALAAAITVQNVPDGFAVAVPAVDAGVSRGRTLLYTTLSGGVPEPIAAAIGFLLVEAVTGLFPLAAGVAAGAMIAVVFRELIPSSHGHGHADAATIAFLAGFVVMIVVDWALAP